APVAAVRGNVDRGAWADELPEERTVEVDGARIHVIHNLKTMTAAPEGCRLVISGHSHKPSIQRCDGVTYLNPGSAGPRRFTLPVAVATIRLTSRGARPKLVELTV
ncbi:MAG: metallophosphoesterase family protein, partial [Deltaproteobacteria bacterium]|nr:metallophosphoesterase family protein [Deltaproteobacteria bacterium]